MRCPFCAAVEDRVVDSRESRDSGTIRRRRECLTCGRRFTTYEKVEEIAYKVVKNDGSRQDFDRAKLLRGLEKACEKRPVAPLQLEEIADGAENLLAEREDREISTRDLGAYVMQRLSRARPGRLRPLRLGLPALRGRRRVHGGAQAPPADPETRRRRRGAGDRRGARARDRPRGGPQAPRPPARPAAQGRGALPVHHRAALGRPRDAASTRSTRRSREHRLVAAGRPARSVDRRARGRRPPPGRHRRRDHAHAEAARRPDPDPRPGHRARARSATSRRPSPFLQARIERIRRGADSRAHARDAGAGALRQGGDRQGRGARQGGLARGAGADRQPRGPGPARRPDRLEPRAHARRRAGRARDARPARPPAQASPSTCTREIQLLTMQQEISSQARGEIDRSQREYFLRQQLRAIQQELGEGDDLAEEVERYRKLAADKGLCRRGPRGDASGRSSGSSGRTPTRPRARSSAPTSTG